MLCFNIIDLKLWSKQKHPIFLFSGRKDEEGERVRGDIDMNEPARMILECDNVEEEEEEDQVIMVSSPNSTVSSVSGKRSHEREENEGERATSSLEDDGGDAAARKKLRLSKEQAAVLEETFKEHNTLNPVSGSFCK